MWAVDPGLGVFVSIMMPFVLDDIDLDAFLRIVAAYGQSDFGYVVTPNVDHLVRLHDEAPFRSAYREAAFTLLDSRVLSRALRLSKGVHVRVCTGSDLTAEVFAKVLGRDDPVVLVGGTDEQARILRSKFSLNRLSHYNPPMGFIHDDLEVERTLRFVEAHSPFRICLLAVGSPQQEFLAQRLKARARTRGLALCVGASINFLTGVERRAPRLLQVMGLEWLYRLATQPRRLARRYLVRGPRALMLLRRTGLEVRLPLSGLGELAREGIS